MRLVLSNRLYAPKGALNKTHLSNFEYYIGNPEDLDTEDTFLCCNYKTYLGSQFEYGVCRGDLAKINTVFKDFEIVDERSIQPHNYPLKFTGSLLEEQKETALDWLNYGYGLIKAPPRWGKSVVLTWLITKLKHRTLVLAHTIDLLNQLKEEFYKNTNVEKLGQDSSGQDLAGVMDDPKVFPIVTFSTWQAFLSPRGSEFLQNNRDSWGLVIVDECHRVGAECYSKIVNKTNSYYRLGVTATPVRSKDQLHVVVNDSLGPVVSEGTTEQLSVDISYINTEYKMQPFSQWSTMENRLAKDNKRNEIIVKKVVDDVRDGHLCVVLTTRVPHCWELARMIEAESDSKKEIRVEVINGKVWGDKRKEIRQQMKRLEIDVLVATCQILQLGFNVPQLSSIHNCMPTTNPENWYQRVSRVRTLYRICPKCGYEPGPKELECPQDGSRFILGKLHPVARIYLDRPMTDHRGSTFGVITSYRKVIEANAKEFGFNVDFDIVPVKKPKDGPKSIFNLVKDS